MATVVSGATAASAPVTAAHPLFVPVTDAPSPRMCACGLGLGPLQDGQTLVASLVFPEVKTGATATLQNTTLEDEQLRLTDVPVGWAPGTSELVAVSCRLP